jgi:hypothetical protein
MKPFCKDYLKSIKGIRKGGHETEGSYYPIIQTLLDDFAKEKGVKRFHSLVLPEQVAQMGAPDLRIEAGDSLIGYIEVKDPKRVSPLSALPKPDRERFEKYQKAPNMNIILTNAAEYRLYRNGKMILDPVSAFDLNDSKVVDEDGLLRLLDTFLEYVLPEHYTPDKLAEALAGRTKWLYDAIKEAREAGDKNMAIFYEGFRTLLISTLTPDEFDDLFAQTITFGLLAARYKAGDEDFERNKAHSFIPPTIGILKSLFNYVSRTDMPDSMNWVVDDLAKVLKRADVPSMMKAYFKHEAAGDPIFYFYQKFLRVYEPKKSEQLGVYYTPEPVISYIVRSVNLILKRHFGRQGGLADEKPVKVLDPAGGTLGFLAEAMRVAFNEYPNQGSVENWGKPHVLENFYGFEFMMAPYVLGHLKMAFMFEELDCQLESDERIQYYLTNTLDLPKESRAGSQMHGYDPVIHEISEEAEEAAKVKRKDTPILVIIGNPPYSGHSQNPSKQRRVVEKGEDYYPANKKPPIVERDGKYILDWDAAEEKVVKGVAQPVPMVKRTAKEQKEVDAFTWIGRLIQDYKIDNGRWLDERNPKWLDDDYVKFFRFAQWKTDQLGEGVIAFITNHGYIDNPTFRGMRQSLMRDFDEMYILDLHGSFRKKEVCPDGSRDENVFDIMNGVAIIFLVKTGEGKGCKVFHQELWGLRNTKYEWLKGNDVESTVWNELSPSEPTCFFMPRDESLEGTYREFWGIDEVFRINSVGIVTGKDELAIHWTRQENAELIASVVGISVDEFYSKYKVVKSKIPRIQEELKAGGEGKIISILCRPFDKRSICYVKKGGGLIERPRPDVMAHMIECENLGLLVCKHVSLLSWQHAFVTDSVEGNCSVSSKTKEREYLFPLYLCNHATGDKEPNLLPNLQSNLKSTYKINPTPEQILYYVYAILYSNIPRKVQAVSDSRLPEDSFSLDV